MADGFAREITDRYDQGAETYRELWAPILRTAALPLLRELAGGPTSRIVDVGTGVGTLLPDLCNAFPNAYVLGVDRSHGMIALAPQRFGLALMDAGALALRSGSVDRLLLLFMLFHLESPLDGLREARRSLGVGGRVGVLTWAGELQSKANAAWTDCLDTHGAKHPDPAAEARHEMVDSPGKMELLLRDAGFHSARSWEGVLSGTLDADQMIRLKTSLGSSKPRFDSLPPAAASGCLAEARRKMAELQPDDFILRGRVVYATGDV